MLLNLPEIASRREEDAEHLGLLLVERAKLTGAKHTGDFGAARAATQANDRELITAHRTVARCVVFKSLLRSARALDHPTLASLLMSEPTRTWA